ncbi:MAG: ABC transporter permease [Actinobacteria bacterium]|nr:MAG: ABC transporter permease [Actinomycetota bacterium]
MNGLFSEVFISSLVSGGVIAGIPLVYAGLGEAISERAGVLNVGLEGMMLGGAFGGFVGALHFHSTWFGLVSGGLTGMVISLFMVVLCVRLNSNQIVVGIAITLGAEGVTALLHGAIYADTYPRVPVAHPYAIPFLSDIPIIGPGFFNHHPSAYLAVVVTFFVAWVLNSTGIGLSIKAAGDQPHALEAAGGGVRRIRTIAVLSTGLLAGLGGSFIVLVGAGIFVPFVTNGKGFIAIVLAMLVRGKVKWIIVASVVFGMSLSLTTALQLVGVDVPIDLVLMLPFVLIIVVLFVFGRRSYLPAALALPYDREQR